MAYPAQGPASVRPHAPVSICGSPVSYDANGNTLSYDSDGAGAGSPRSLAWDGENRPLIITRNGAAATFSPARDSLLPAAPARSRRGEAPLELR